MKQGPLAIMLGMIVIIAVSFTTATFAWYTSNTKVDLTGGSVQAAGTSAGDLRIGWGTTASASSIAMGEATGLVPMIPVAAPERDTTTYAAFTANANFNSATQDPANGNFRAGTVAQTAPTTMQDGGATTSIVNLTNAATVAFTGGITAKVTISDATGSANADNLANAKSALRVAVFAGATAASTTFKGVWGLGETAWGVLVADTDWGGLTTKGKIVSMVSGASVSLADTLAANTSMTVYIVVWFDGEVISNLGNNITVPFAIEFNGVQA